MMNPLVRPYSSRPIPAPESTSRGFRRNRWGTLKQNSFPVSIVDRATGQLRVGGKALAIYLVLLYRHWVTMVRHRRLGNYVPFANVQITHKRLMELTGFTSQRSMTAGIDQLKEAGLISVEPGIGRRAKEKRRGRSGGVYPDSYWLLDPDDPTNGSLSSDGQLSILAANRRRYISFPRVFITKSDARWSLANLLSSEVAAYVALLWLVGKQKQDDNCTETQMRRLRKLTGLGTVTTRKALDRLEELGLIRITPEALNPYANGSDRPYEIELCDPLTGSPVTRPADPTENLQNFFLRGSRKAFDYNCLTSEQVHELIQDAVGDRVPLQNDNGELLLRCPFHADSTPSLSANINKQGCFYCHACKEQGNLTKLIAKLRGIPLSEAVPLISKVEGFDVEYQDPDEGANVYPYKDVNGRIRKEVVVRRFEDGRPKKVYQRQPNSRGDMILGYNGPPVLYHHELISQAETICITEGEKDADVMTSIRNPSLPSARIVGVTSGGAASWDAKFATELRGKKVIVMPDDDEAGKVYENAVVSSLRDEGIDFRVVKFGEYGAKDVSEFLEGHSPIELEHLIGEDWLPKDWCHNPLEDLCLLELQESYVM